MIGLLHLYLVPQLLPQKEAIYDKFLCNEDENSWPRNCVDIFGSNFHEIFRGIEMPKKNTHDIDSHGMPMVASEAHNVQGADTALLRGMATIADRLFPEQTTVQKDSFHIVDDSTYTFNIGRIISIEASAGYEVKTSLMIKGKDIKILTMRDLFQSKIPTDLNLREILIFTSDQMAKINEEEATLCVEFCSMKIPFEDFKNREIKEIVQVSQTQVTKGAPIDLKLIYQEVVKMRTGVMIL